MHLHSTLLPRTLRKFAAQGYQAEPVGFRDNQDRRNEWRGLRMQFPQVHHELWERSVLSEWLRASALPSQCAATQLRWIAANRLNMQDPLRQCQCQVPAMLWQQALSIRHSSISFLQSAATFAKDFRDAMRLLPHLIFS